MEFSIGANYWPARQGMGLWRSFDTGEVREDFARMAEWGLTPVRIFLLWEDFQPEPHRVNLKALDRLLELAQYAHDRQRGLWVTLFTGHVHGANWLPAWMVQSNRGKGPSPVIVSSIASSLAPRNPYEQEARGAQRRLIREVLAAIGGHPALWGWDLGNAPSNVSPPTDRDQGMQWLQEMVEEIRGQDPSHPITLSLHQMDLEEDRFMGPGEVARACDVIGVQAYPACVPWSRGPTDALFPLFLAVLTKWLGQGGDVWVSALGISTRRGDERDRLSTDEETASRYALESLEGLRRHGISGALWWCYADYAPTFWGQVPFVDRPYERSSGLVRYDGTPKAILEAICEMQRSRGGEDLPSDWIDVEPEAYWEDPGGHIRRLYRRFLECAPFPH